MNKPHIKQIGPHNWRVYYPGWREFSFSTLVECIGLIRFDSFLSSKGFDIYLVESYYIDNFGSNFLPRLAKEFTKNDSGIDWFIKRLERLKKDMVLI